MGREGASVRRSPLHWSRFLYAVLFVSLVAAGLYCGYFAYTTLREFAANTQFRAIPAIAPESTAQAQQDPLHPEEPAPQSDPPQQSVVFQHPDIENKERVNILFLGIDQRPGESTACRTDTMILASINPRDMSISLLSIPRDLWVPIPHPKHPEAKINTAHYWGEIEHYPGGGPALAMKTVQRNFGVRVHYYVRLNFVGFERIIDRIGGIYVDVPVTIDDPEYPNGSYGVEHLHIDAGRHLFGGELALKYARTRRGTGDGDFTRMERQQQVILAVRDRVLSLPNLPQLVLQLPQLYREMGDSVETDIPVESMFTLAKLAQQVKSDDIHMATINREMTTDWRTLDGLAVLVYDRDKARPIVDALFSDPTPEIIATEASQVERLESERARVAVYNGTTIPGLAATIGSFLGKQGIDVVRFDNADRSDYERTIAQVYGDKAFTVEWLTNWLIDLGIPEPEIRMLPAEDDVDIAITIGRDFPVDEIR